MKPQPNEPSITLPSRHAPRVITLGLVGLLFACAEKSETPEPIPGDSYAYMDSVSIYLGDLRYIEHRMKMVIGDGRMAEDVIVPLIREHLDPRMRRLRDRAGALTPPEEAERLQELLLSYLDTRLQAYEAAMQGYDEDRDELYTLFAQKQAEAQEIAFELEEAVRQLR